MRNRMRERITVLATVLSISLCLSPLPASAVNVGDKAPDFLMHSTAGETVQLSQYLGRKHVLLFFFVAAFTGG
jgi:peroxiredoxin Q/BCP